MTLAAALTQLATWTPSGIAVKAYSFRGQVQEVDKPCMVMRLADTFDESFQMVNVALDAGQVLYHVDHILLVRGVGQGLPDAQSDIVTHIDNYLAAAILDPTLNDVLARPLRILPLRVGIIPYANMVHDGVVFTHQWAIEY